MERFKIIFKPPNAMKYHILVGNLSAAQWLWNYGEPLCLLWILSCYYLSNTYSYLILNNYYHINPPEMSDTVLSFPLSLLFTDRNTKVHRTEGNLKRQVMGNRSGGSKPGKWQSRRKTVMDSRLPLEARFTGCFETVRVIKFEVKVL